MSKSNGWNSSRSFNLVNLKDKIFGLWSFKLGISKFEKFDFKVPQFEFQVSNIDFQVCNCDFWILKDSMSMFQTLTFKKLKIWISMFQYWNVKGSNFDFLNVKLWNFEIQRWNLKFSKLKLKIWTTDWNFKIWSVHFKFENFEFKVWIYKIFKFYIWNFKVWSFDSPLLIMIENSKFKVLNFEISNLKRWDSDFGIWKFRVSEFEIRIWTLKNS